MPYAAIKPDASAFQDPAAQGYMQQLGADLNNPLRRLELLKRMRSGGQGVQGYLQALSEAQQAQLQGSAQEGAMEIDKAYLNNVANMANAGVAGAVQLRSPTYLNVDPSRLDVADVVNLNEGLSGNFKTTTEGIENLAGAGYLPPAETVGQMITGPFEEQAMTVQPYMTPEDQSKRMTAEAAQTNAAANMIDAKNPRKYSSSSSNDDKTVTTYILGPNGERTPLSATVTSKGQPTGPVGTTSVQQRKFEIVTDENGKPQVVIKGQ
jgi:hypothetical protein